MSRGAEERAMQKARNEATELDIPADDPAETMTEAAGPVTGGARRPELRATPPAERRGSGDGGPGPTMVSARDFSLFYGSHQALKRVTLDVPRHSVTAIIGPSGCGKSTLLRSFNRMNDLIPGVRTEGEARVGGASVHATDVVELRRRVGMVFQRPNPFPLSVLENIAFGPKIHGLGRHNGLAARVQSSLEQTGLWDDLKDRLHSSALTLSAEQQQRLCISRLLAVESEVLLMDEPCSALDPIATAHIEELLLQMQSRYTIVIVTHNMQQAARIASEAAFMLLGELIEFGETATLFTTPRDRRTEEYITGRYG
jgi:phosphate transport system ATP-binding protein